MGFDSPSCINFHPHHSLLSSLPSLNIMSPTCGDGALLPMMTIPPNALINFQVWAVISHSMQWASTLKAARVGRGDQKGPWARGIVQRAGIQKWAERASTFRAKVGS